MALSKPASSYVLEKPEHIYGPPPHGPEPSWLDGSTFADDRWRATSINDRPVSLNFGKIPPRFRLTGKYYLWALEYETDTRFNARSPSAVSTYKVQFCEFVKFARYADSIGCLSFAMLRREQISDYAKARVAGRAVYTSSFATRIGVLTQRLYHLGPLGNGTLPDGLSILYSVKELERLIPATTHVRATPIMPETVARGVVNAALEMVSAIDDVVLIFSLSRGDLGSQKYIQSLDEEALDSYWSDLSNNAPQIGRAVSAARRLRDRFPMIEAGLRKYIEGPSDYRGLFLCKEAAMLLVQLSVTACFIVVAALTGFRASEITSIRRGDIKGSGVGVLVTSRVNKHVERAAGVRHERPGHIYMLQVDAALTKLAAFSEVGAYWRSTSSGLNSKYISEYLNRFSAIVANIEEWHLTSRQFRRYFAIFHVTRFLGQEDALRRAFHHTTNSALDSYVRDRDGALFMRQAKQGLAEEIFFALALGRPTFATIGTSPTLSELQGYVAVNLPVEDIEIELKKHLEDRSLEVWPTAWGFCMMQKGDELGAMCGRKSGKPVALEMYPGNCGRCRHLAVGRDQIGFWQGTRETHAMIVASNAATPILKREAALMMRISDSIIASLSEA